MVLWVRRFGPCFLTFSVLWALQRILGDLLLLLMEIFASRKSARLDVQRSLFWLVVALFIENVRIFRIVFSVFASLG